jgi:hypothetical protein
VEKAMSAQNDEPPRGKGESEEEGRDRARRGFEASSEYAGRVASRLLDGSDDERQAILEGLNLLSAERQANVRPYLENAISNIRKGSYSDERMGWLTSALVIVAGEDPDALNVVQQHLHPKVEGNEWVRYWTLAQLFWTRGSTVAARFARAAAVDESSPLVEELALAIIRDSTGQPPNVPTFDDDRALARLRALQVVATPEAVPRLTEFVFSRPNPQLTYEALRALTASPDVTRIAGEMIATRISSKGLVEIIIDSLSGAKPRLLARFGQLLRPIPAAQVGRALIEVFKERGIAESRGRELVEQLRLPGLAVIVAPPAPLPPGAWRAELAYRSVLQQPTTFDLLESLSATQLSSVLQQAGIATSDTAPDALASLARSIGVGGSPNALWLAWIKNVHAARLTQD